jgi:hypothetical protein
MTDFSILLICLGFSALTWGIVLLCDHLVEHAGGAKR